MGDVSALSDLSWYLGPAMVAARVTAHWKHQGYETNTLPTRCLGFRSGCHVSEPFVSSLLPTRSRFHNKTADDAENEGADGLMPLNAEPGQVHGLVGAPLSHHRPHLLRAKKFLHELDHNRGFPALDCADQRRPQSAEQGLKWTSVRLNSGFWNHQKIRSSPTDLSTAKVIPLDGPGNGLVVRSSPIFVYPHCADEGNSLGPGFILCFNLAGGLSVSLVEDVLRAEAIIGNGKLVKTEQQRPDVLFTATARPGAYKIVTPTDTAEVFICPFQAEHVGHRGCLAAGYSYFVCGLSGRTPPYRVVGAGYCGRSRFVLSRSYAGDCPRLPLFHCHLNENAIYTSETQCPGTMRCAFANTPASIEEKGTSPPVDGCVASPNQFDERTFAETDVKQSPFDNDGLIDSPGVNLCVTEGLTERLQNFGLDGNLSESAGSVLDICLFNCIERKSSAAMLREMAVLLNDERTMVTFDLRVCGLCAPSRALLNETRSFRRQISTCCKQQTSVEKPKKNCRKFGQCEVAKYFNQRYRLISRFENDLQLSDEAWFSICPEEIGKHIARRIAALSRTRGGRRLRLLDPCCGAGGNVVQCAVMAEVEHVYANDLKEQEVASARRLAALYEVEHKITFGCSNLFDLRGETVGKVDAVVFSPPWGGPEYLDRPTFNIDEMTPSYTAILRHCRQFSPNIAVLLPRNVCLDQLAASAEDLHKSWSEAQPNCLDPSFELELNLINKKCKTATVYYGELVNRAVRE